MSALTFECGQANQNTNNQEYQTDEEPYYAPGTTGHTSTTTNFRKLGRIRFISFPKHQIVQNIPETVQTGHYPI